MESVLGFYKRVQLIIGVYMVFHLAVLIMKGIFNTDTVSGKNNNEFIKKIIIALTMLTVLTPVNIPNAQNEYEKQILAKDLDKKEYNIYAEDDPPEGV